MTDNSPNPNVEDLITISISGDPAPPHPVSSFKYVDGEGLVSVNENSYETCKKEIRGFQNEVESYFDSFNHRSPWVFKEESGRKSWLVLKNDNSYQPDRVPETLSFHGYAIAAGLMFHGGCMDTLTWEKLTKEKAPKRIIAITDIFRQDMDRTRINLSDVSMVMLASFIDELLYLKKVELLSPVFESPLAKLLQTCTDYEATIAIIDLLRLKHVALKIVEACASGEEKRYTLFGFRGYITQTALYEKIKKDLTD